MSGQPEKEPDVECLEVTDATPSRSLKIDELKLGQAVFEKVVFDSDRLSHFAKVANDRAPVHNDPRFARTVGFEKPIIQGLALSTRFSRLIGMYLPGERAVLEKIELKYRAPVFAGSTLIYQCKVVRVMRPLNVVQLGLSITVDGREHVSGQCQCVLR